MTTFKLDADELESWIWEKLEKASDEAFKKSTNLPEFIEKHQILKSKVLANSSAVVLLMNNGNKLVSDRHFAADIIKNRLEQLNAAWKLLLSRVAEKGQKLEQALVLAQFLKRCDDVLLWIQEKKDPTANVIELKLEVVEVLQTNSDEFQKEMASEEITVVEVNSRADKLISDGHPERETVERKRKEVNSNWKNLKQVAENRRKQLSRDLDYYRFSGDADEVIACIKEKDVILSSDEVGRDLADIQTFQKKHERLERDLATLEDKVNSVRADADRLYGIHGDQTFGSKRNDIVENWEALVKKAKLRKTKLDDTYALHHFLSGHCDLLRWTHNMKQLISADDYLRVKDIAGAKALLERHYKHKGEMDAREDSFKLISDSGSLMMERNHLAASEVAQNLQSLNEEKIVLWRLWEERRKLYDQSLELQKFNHDVKAFSVTLKNSLTSLIESATKMIDGHHFAADAISNERNSLVQLSNGLSDEANKPKLPPQRISSKVDETLQLNDDHHQNHDEPPIIATGQQADNSPSARTGEGQSIKVGRIRNKRSISDCNVTRDNKSRKCRQKQASDTSTTQ